MFTYILCKRVADETFHFDSSKTFVFAVAKTIDWETESSSSTTTFPISVAEPYLCVPGLGRMIPPLARLYCRRWPGPLRLAVLLWGYQSLAQRCCFVQSSGSLLASTRACSQLWSCWSLRSHSFTARGLSVLRGVGAEPKSGSSHFLCLWQKKGWFYGHTEGNCACVLNGH